MRIVTINGESKTCKSTISGMIARQVGGTTADAGQFFRTLTHDTLDALRIEHPVPPPYDALDEAVREVIANGTAFRQRPRDDLYRPVIEAMVTPLSSRPGVQEAGVQWFERTVKAAVADGIGTLVINGRNPNERMATALRDTGLRVNLSLLMDCEPEIAARRVLMNQDVFDPSEPELQAQTARIMARRELDRERTDTPFTFPDRLVTYEPDVTDPFEAIAMAQAGGTPNVPLEIYFDTSYVGRESMATHAHLLAAAALAQCVR